MSVTSNSNGSQTATIDTEHSLGIITTAGVYQLQIDVNAMAAADRLVVRTYKKVRSVGTTRLIDEFTISGAQTEKVAETIPQFSTNEVEFRIEQIAGTGRAFPWEIIAA